MYLLINVNENSIVQSPVAAPPSTTKKSKQSADSGQDGDGATAVDFSKLKVTELREECEKRGLDSSGKKAELVSRLEGSSSTCASTGMLTWCLAGLTPINKVPCLCSVSQHEGWIEIIAGWLTIVHKEKICGKIFENCHTLKFNASPNCPATCTQYLSTYQPLMLTCCAQ